MNGNCPSVVRKALPADYDSIWQLLELLHKENGIFNLSKGKVDWLLNRILYPEKIAENDMGQRGYMGVIGQEGGHLEGLLLLTIGCPWYSEDIYFEELANFVHPDHRKSDHAKTLIAYSKYIADKVGLSLVIGVLSNTRTAAKVRLYRRQLPEAGAFFVYGSPHFASQGGKI